MSAGRTHVRARIRYCCPGHPFCFQTLAQLSSRALVSVVPIGPIMLQFKPWADVAKCFLNPLDEECYINVVHSWPGVQVGAPVTFGGGEDALVVGAPAQAQAVTVTPGTSFASYHTMAARLNLAIELATAGEGAGGGDKNEPILNRYDAYLSSRWTPAQLAAYVLDRVP